MYIIQLKFYHKKWRNYFHKQFTKDEAFDLFSKLVSCFPSNEWRLVYLSTFQMEDLL